MNFLARLEDFLDRNHNAVIAMSAWLALVCIAFCLLIETGRHIEALNWLYQ